MTGYVDVPLVYLRFIFQMLFPMFLFLVFFLQYRIIYRKNIYYRKIGQASSFLVVWLLFIPFIFKTILGYRIPLLTP